MQYSLYIDQKRSVEWRLTPKQALLFSYITTATKWAQSTTQEESIYYFLSKNKLCQEMPLVATKTNTMYKYIKQLEEKGVILHQVIKNMTHIAITNKGKMWGKQGNIVQESTLKIAQGMDNYPPQSGQTSIQGVDNYPPYQYTNINESNYHKKIARGNLSPEYSGKLSKEKTGKENSNVISFPMNTKNIPPENSEPEFTGGNVNIEDILNNEPDYTEMNPHQLIESTIPYYTKGKVGPHSLSALWKRVHAKHKLGNVKQITMKEKGYLGNYLKAVGTQSELVLVTCVSDWYGFLSYVATQVQEHINTGAKPAMTMLLKYSNLAIDYYDIQNAPIIKKPTKPNHSLTKTISPVITKPTTVDKTAVLDVFSKLEKDHE